MTPKKTDQFTKRLTNWGFGISVAYALFLLFLCLGRGEQLWSMELNQVGDFLAGTFSPLAFLWLVIGYLQQGHELSASVAALEHQGKVFEAQRREDMERFVAATTPKLVYIAGAVHPHPDIPLVWEFRATNVGGAPCALATLKASTSQVELTETELREIQVHDNESTTIEWTHGGRPSPMAFQIEVNYLQGSIGLRKDVVDLEFVQVGDILVLRVVPGSTHEIPRN